MAKAVKVKVNWHPAAFNTALDKDLDRRVEKCAISYKQAVKNSFGSGTTPNIVTGELKESIEAVKIGKLKWGIGSAIKYVSFLEFGTSKMPAKPFLRPMLNLFGRKIQSFFRS